MSDLGMLVVDFKSTSELTESLENVPHTFQYTNHDGYQTSVTLDPTSAQVLLAAKIPDTRMAIRYSDITGEPFHIVAWFNRSFVPFVMLVKPTENIFGFNSNIVAVPLFSLDNDICRVTLKKLETLLKSIAYCGIINLRIRCHDNKLYLESLSDNIERILPPQLFERMLNACLEEPDELTKMLEFNLGVCKYPNQLQHNDIKFFSAYYLQSVFTPETPWTKIPEFEYQKNVMRGLIPGLPYWELKQDNFDSPVELNLDKRFYTIDTDADRDFPDFISGYRIKSKNLTKEENENGV
jgi:hypothetical protein